MALYTLPESKSTRQSVFAKAEPDAQSSSLVASLPGKPGTVMVNLSRTAIVSLTLTKSHSPLPWKGTDSSDVKHRMSAWWVYPGS